MTAFIHPIKQKSLLFKAFAISLAIHAAGLIYFYSHPLLLHNSWESLFGRSSMTPTVLTFEEESKEMAQKNKELEESFEEMITLSSHLQKPWDLNAFPEGIALSPSSEEERSFELMFEPPRYSSIEDKLSFESIAVTEEPSLVETPEGSLVLLDETPLASMVVPIVFDPFASPIAPPSIQEDLRVENDAIDADFAALDPSFKAVLPETDQLGVQLAQSSPLFLEEADLTPRLKTDSKRALDASEKLASDEFSGPAAPLFLSEAPPNPQEMPAKEFSTSSEIGSYDLPECATATEWNADFAMKLQFLPKTTGEGYSFSIEISPSFDVSAYTLKQNFHFILDRSSSIEKHRFAIFKRGVLKALASMKSGESFNIYFLDKKMTRMSATPIPYSMKAVLAAEAFMEKQEAGGIFSSSDIYASLEKILPDLPLDGSVNTAVLLTDGKSSLNHSKQQQTLKRLVEKNNHRLSIYTAAIGNKNDLLLLDLLSSISGGKLLYADTHASFPRKLAKLIIDLHDPIATDLVISATPKKADSHIELYPASGHLPNLYSHNPYVIIGQIDKPCNFDLLIEGKHNDQWVSIKKRVSFVEGEKANRSLEKQWNGAEAHLSYSKFLKEGKVAYLDEAKEILKKSRIGFE